MLQDLFLDEPSHGATAGGVALFPRFSLPPLFVASSSLSGLTRPEESRLSAHARERPEAPAEATAAAAAAEDPAHRAQAAVAAADAILAAASPKRPGGGRGGADSAWGGATQAPTRAGGVLPRHPCPGRSLVLRRPEATGCFDSQSQNLLVLCNPLSPLWSCSDLHH